MIAKEDLAKIKQLIETIEAEPSAFDFLEPVDYIRKNIKNIKKIKNLLFFHYIIIK
jgi:hypothetical protein